jgi:uncharacterized membrane protein
VICALLALGLLIVAIASWTKRLRPIPRIVLMLVGVVIVYYGVADLGLLPTMTPFTDEEWEHFKTVL